MKHLKIKLSVLALACLGAGAFALQPANYAKAEDAISPEACLEMTKGAAVCLQDSFSGIRWTTKIDHAKYAEVVAANEGKDITFGTLVLPTSKLGDDELLTIEDAGAMDLPANIPAEGITKNTTYYSVINYNAIAAENQSKAYALELTARSYVKVGDDYYYANLGSVDTSRSARQVAIAAEVAGDLDEFTEQQQAKAAGYYGETSRLTYEGKGSIKSDVIDLSKYTAESKPEFTIDLELTENVAEVYLGSQIGGSQKLATTYDAELKQLTIALPEGKKLPTGEFHVSLFTASGKAVVKPVIFATKVLKTVDDLKMFNAKGNDGKNTAQIGSNGANISKYWKPEQEQSGYYVLGANINASNYSHGSGNTSTWNGAKNYEGKPIGLTGTFNGLGYKINGMKIKTAREGFFGIVNGGTVKNVAFTNVKSTLNGYAFVLANYLWKATIDNVYIETNTYNKDDRTNNPGFNYNSVGSGILASTAYQTKISNILIRMNKGPKTAQANFGALFGGTHSDEEFTCENVFVYVKQHFQYAKSNTAIVDEVETTTYTYETNNYYATMMTQHPAFTDEQVDGEGEGTGVYNAWSVDEKTGKNIKGLLYLAENQVADAKAETLAPVNAKILTQFYDLKVLKGVYYYGQNDTWGAYDPAGFLASGCWTAESGTRPAWGA